MHTRHSAKSGPALLQPKCSTQSQTEWPHRADSAHAADVVTAAGRTDLAEAIVRGNAGSCKRRASPQEGLGTRAATPRSGHDVDVPGPARRDPFRTISAAPHPRPLWSESGRRTASATSEAAGSPRRKRAPRRRRGRRGQDAESRRTGRATLGRVSTDAIVRGDCPQERVANLDDARAGERRPRPPICRPLLRLRKRAAGFRYNRRNG
jgi:hypothetical protein